MHMYANVINRFIPPQGWVSWKKQISIRSLPGEVINLVAGSLMCNFFSLMKSQFKFDLKIPPIIAPPWGLINARVRYQGIGV